MDSDKHVCPVCRHPVQTVVQRHKTLGAWVPRWVGGPCHNPECEAHVDKDAEDAGSDEDHGDKPTAKKS